jgi:SPP1 family phage portal protein
MRNLAIMKERKFKTAMQNRYKMIFNLPTNVPASMRDEWMNIQYQFTRNLPRNIVEEAGTAAKLEGVISKETQLGLLSFVENPKEEMDRIADETPQATGFDFEKSE